VFSAELGDVLSVAARRVEIRIECLGDVRPLEIIGRDGRIDGRTVILTLNQMYGGQEKYALVRVKVPANKTGARRRVATATVRYEDALTQKPGEASAEVELSFSKDLAVVERSLNASVQREYELNATALSRDNAITLADAGKVKEAAAELKKSAATLRQAAEKLQDASLAGKAKEYDRNADDLEQRGWDSVSRKGMRTDNYQIYNQQQQK
jgi:Ca-activated chloride channel family protein